MYILHNYIHYIYTVYTCPMDPSRDVVSEKIAAKNSLSQ